MDPGRTDSLPQGFAQTSRQAESGRVGGCGFATSPMRTLANMTADVRMPK